MSDETTEYNVIEFIRDSSDIYFVLGAVCGAYQQLNDISKYEFLSALKEKTNMSSDKQSNGALMSFIGSLESIDK